MFCVTRSSASRLLDLDAGGAVETEEFLQLGFVIANHLDTDRNCLQFSSIGRGYAQPCASHLSVVLPWQIVSDQTDSGCPDTVLALAICMPHGTSNIAL